MNHTSSKVKKKVLMFLQSGVGGAERVTVTIGKNLDKAKYDVVFCLVGHETGDIENFIPKGYKIEHIKNKNPIALIWAYGKKIFQEKPNAVFASVMNINTKLLLWTFLFRKIKFIVRSDNNFRVFSKIQQLLIRFTYRLANYVIAQTAEMANELISGAKLEEKKCIVLANPIDESYIKEHLQNAVSPYKNNGNIHFVASGRFAEAKGFDLLIKAFASVHKTNPETDLHILGRTGEPDNPIFKTVSKLIQKQALSHCVFLTGQLKNPYPYIKFADCFVLSSRYEGFPNVLLESLYLHTPVAAFRCIPIIERVVHEGVNGYTADAENENDLATAMEKACKLGRISNNYKPATSVEFEHLFAKG